jgi:hypothetical protein
VLGLVASLIQKIRYDARTAGRERLQRELRTVVAATPGGVGYDAARARMVASSYQKALFTYARSTGSLEMAALATDVKVRTIAATETAQAFNLERDRAARQVAAEQGVVLWKVWDSVLDRRTCQTCEQMHGRAVPASEDFSEGRPGGVHPLCRCTESILTVDQIDFGRNL